jgi:hypothetical protein
VNPAFPGTLGFVVPKPKDVKFSAIFFLKEYTYYLWHTQANLFPNIHRSMWVITPILFIALPGSAG